MLVADLVAGLAFVVAGLLVRGMRPGNRCWWLLMATGATWLVGSLHTSTDTDVALTGFVLGVWHFFALSWLLLAYPTGRLPGRREQVLLALVGLLCAVRSLSRLLLYVPPDGTGCGCVRNRFVPVTDARWYDAVDASLPLAARRRAAPRAGVRRGPLAAQQPRRAPDGRAGPRDRRGGRRPGRLRLRRTSSGRCGRARPNGAVPGGGQPSGRDRRSLRHRAPPPGRCPVGGGRPGGRPGGPGQRLARPARGGAAPRPRRPQPRAGAVVRRRAVLRRPGGEAGCAGRGPRPGGDGGRAGRRPGGGAGARRGAARGPGSGRGRRRRRAADLGQRAAPERAAAPAHRGGRVAVQDRGRR